MNHAHFDTFHQLHHADRPLLLPNAWDAASAYLLQREGAPAVATSSAALAWSLGYADGGSLPREELRGAVRRIARVVTVPLSIDIEDGYSDSPEAVATLAGEIAALGACGINLEDGDKPPALLADKIAAIRRMLGDTRLFINARTDVYLRGMAQGDDAIRMCANRLRLYREAGADSGFVPGMCRLDDVAALAPAIDMPLALMMMPGMPRPAELFAAGARRFTVATALFHSAHAGALEAIRPFLREGATGRLFEQTLPAGLLDGAFAPR